MNQNNRDENGQEITFFAPGQLAFLVEHAEPFDPGRIIEGLQAHPLMRDARLRKVEFSAERVLTFAPQQPYSQPEQGLGASQQFPFRHRTLRDAVIGLVPFLRPEAPPARRGSHTLLFGDLVLPDDEMLRLVDDSDHLLQEFKDAAPGGVALRAVTPNWLSAGAPYHIGTGGPGAQPVPVEVEAGAAWHTASADVEGAPFSFELPPALRDTSPGNGVQVAILDTAPTAEAMKEAYKKWHADHPILRGLLGPTGELPSARLRLLAGDRALFDRLNSEDGGFQIDGHRYDMSDHGLFIAGIIHSIAPQAMLTLVRVLNDFGVGTLETITRGLHTVYGLRDRSRPLIVNMSLTLSIPLKGHRQPHFGPKRLFSDEGFVKRMGSPLEWTCDLLEADGVMIVAAAGNDGQNGHRPYARQPAAFDSVIGVGALGRDGKPARYSNLADRPSPIGIATFGGDARSEVQTLSADPEGGVMGVYIGRFPDGSPSENGWARWAGTSFAAPVISGVLARLRSTVYSPEDALRKVYEAQADVTPSPALEEIFTMVQGGRRL